MNTGGLFKKKPIDLIIKDIGEIEEKNGMRRTLTVFDLTAMGIAAIIGAGIFSSIGNAAASGGPAVSLLFVFTAIACGLSAMCYAEFASSIPLSGSAYTYAYASFGELVAWIIGWALIMEYSVGNIAVAISWSGYFTGLMSGIGLHIPEYLSIDYFSALRGYTEASVLLKSGVAFNELNSGLQDAYLAWQNAPLIGNLRVIANFPAFTIVIMISWLVFKGIYETKIAGNLMVALKIIILLMVIVIGAFYVDPGNWTPFAPNGLTGVLKGVSGVFFAYIGFDAISTTAEECKNPRRDLPRSMIYALIVTTVLYVGISLILTGMIPFTELGVSDPLAYAFEKLHLTKLSGIIAFSAVIAMTGVLLVFQMGQPRIWMSMSRDGLLPAIFSKLHKKYRTPFFATIVAGCIVAIPSLFTNLAEVTDLTSIGTLFAFILVSGGILILNPHGKITGKGFHVPYINSRIYLIPAWIIIFIILVSSGAFNLSVDYDVTSITLSYLAHKLPFLLFVLVSFWITIMAVLRKWTLIPILGLLTNMYLMSELGINNWLFFFIWLLIGLVLYFAYGARHSVLKR